MALVAVAGTVTAAAAAGDRICRGTINAIPVDDNIRVPQGATCTLNRTRVKGNVLVSSGATLVAVGGARGRQRPGAAGAGEPVPQALARRCRIG
jgi:hypothetical protein